MFHLFDLLHPLLPLGVSALALAAPCLVADLATGTAWFTRREPTVSTTSFSPVDADDQAEGAYADIAAVVGDEFGILTDAELASIDASIDAGFYDMDDAWIGEHLTLDQLDSDRLAEVASDEYAERLFSADRY